MPTSCCSTASPTGSKRVVRGKSPPLAAPQKKGWSTIRLARWSTFRLTITLFAVSNTLCTIVALPVPGAPVMMYLLAMLSNKFGKWLVSPWGVIAEANKCLSLDSLRYSLSGKISSIKRLAVKFNSWMLRLLLIW